MEKLVCERSKSEREAVELDLASGVRLRGRWRGVRGSGHGRATCAAGQKAEEELLPALNDIK